jgi:thioesterase domain-containing protein/NADPH:quinone reductase-like Zn-dependent oxidoreductase/acyl carrier protein
LAAIQIAQDVGAQIFATAGSDEKREYLRSLGVPHVMNSRTLEFADQIMELTEQQGVDVVLNSLPGDAIERSLSVLRAYGRFLEIGKIDIYQNRMIGLLPFQDNLTYTAIDLDRMLRQRPDYIRDMFEELMQYFHNGTYRPLNLTEFPMEDVTDAFRYMSQRKNIGKIVTSLERAEADAPEAPECVGAVREDGSYLITGGLGALGLRTAEWLIDQGARHVVLLSRRAPTEETAGQIAALGGSEAQVVAVQGDVADSHSLTEALAQIPDEFPPLRGVMHAAGVLDDGLMVEMDLAQLDKPMAAKVQGAWNLHAATLDQPLDFFVLFSSVSAIMGTVGQGNYAAGNAFLDGLAHYRRSQGLPAISMNWGAWAGAGMASDLAEDMKARGVTLLPPDKCFEILEGVLATKPVQTTTFIAEWPRLLRLYIGGAPPLLRDIESAQAETEGDSAESEAFRRELLDMAPKQREQRLRQFFAEQLAEIMGMEPEDLDLVQPLNTLGLDSLMAIELRNKMETQLKVTLPMALFMEGPSVSRLAEYVSKAVGGEIDEEESEESVEPDEAAEDSADSVAPLATLLPETESAGDWSPIVRLQTGGGRMPLFLLHPAGGSVYCYHALAHQMDKDVPIYALQGRGLETDQEPHASWDDMVSEQTKAILGVQEKGPYHLAGWSTGGVLAYAVAERLRAGDAEVDLIAMFDSRTPVCTKIDPEDEVQVLELIDLYRRFGADEHSVSRKELAKLESDERLELILERAREAGLAGTGISVAHLRRFLDAAKANLRALLSYQPETSELPVDQFRAVHDSTEDGLSLGWQKVVPDTLTVHVVPAGHYNIMTGEHAVSLAEFLGQRVPKCEG